MDSNRTEAQRIADEAVGQRPATAIPDASKASITTPDTVRQQARSVGPGASVAGLTAESVGERDDGAYAYGHATLDEVRRREASFKVRRRSGSTFGEPSYVRLIAAFALGYSAALLIHRRG
jgi:hypothetical protein